MTRSLTLAVLSEAEPRRDFLLHARVFAEAFDPLDARLAPEPRELALGVVAHVELRLIDGALKRALAPKVLDGAAVAVRPQRARRCGRRMYLERLRRLCLASDRIRRSEPKEIQMKTPTYIVTLAVAAVAACGTPLAQAHMVRGNGAHASAKAKSAQQQAWIKTIHMLGRSLPSYAR